MFNLHCIVFTINKKFIATAESISTIPVTSFQSDLFTLIFIYYIPLCSGCTGPSGDTIKLKYLYIHVNIYIYKSIYILLFRLKVDALRHLERHHQLYLIINIYIYTLWFPLQLMHSIMWRHCIICVRGRVCIKPRPASQIRLESDTIISLKLILHVEGYS